jgi:penicillin-binding protein 2
MQFNQNSRPSLSQLYRLGCGLVLIAVALSGCSAIHLGAASRTPVSPLSAPGNSLDIPGVQATADKFLAAWQQENYAGMYSLLTQVSQDSISAADFDKAYRSAAVNLSLQKIDTELLSALTNPQSAQVGFRTTYHTALLGDLKRDMILNFTLEKGEWRIQWGEELILPELKGGNRLSIDYKVPARGDIYDRNGKALAALADVVAIGVEPAKLKKSQEQDMLGLLAELTGNTQEDIQALYSQSNQAYVPIGEVTAQEVQNQSDRLTSITGLVMHPYRARFYFNEGVAPQVTGYVLSISPEQLEEYRRNGYSGDEKVGAAGLEKWGENYLTGKRGASVYVVSPDNQIVTRLAETNSEPAKFIYTTIDKDLQIQAQKAIQGFRGSIVVLERDTGRVLAMVSSPGYNPNLFDPGNFNNSALSDVLNDSQQRLLNRAAQGTYPLGSVSKIVTMAAALESGDFTAASTYNCGYEFTELGSGQVLYDWTYTAGVNPSGLLTLPEGLMVSCNPWFWHIGLELYHAGKGAELSKMAHAFGLGKTTGMDLIGESAGSYPDPQNEGDAVQMAIGQGPMLVTPLQVADFVAAVGNGGNLYKPQLIEKIASPDGDPVQPFKPVVAAKLPLSPENLATIQDAMLSVVEDRRGTARNVFTGLQIPVYGKTGTAQNAGEMPHAWFAGYTDAGRTDRPDIAIAVLAENAGEGSWVAAPIFRRVVEIYFSGKPIKLYPWESSFYVVPTPVPTVTPTPVPSNTPSPTPAPTATSNLPTATPFKAAATSKP